MALHGRVIASGTVSNDSEISPKPNEGAVEFLTQQQPKYTNYTLHFDEEVLGSLTSIEPVASVLKTEKRAGTVRTGLYQTSVIPIANVRHEGATPVSVSLQEAFESNPIRNIWAMFVDPAEEKRFKNWENQNRLNFSETYITIGVTIFAGICFTISYYIPKELIKRNSHVFSAVFVFLLFNPQLTISYYYAANKVAVSNSTN
ncbi:hypothetical protein HDU97_008926 [Phlyctochytrium planicorne]|nr:hypothetical protein HDU97_008926 [Phlyctochytrium planicorne]